MPINILMTWKTFNFGNIHFYIIKRCIFSMIKHVSNKTIILFQNDANIHFSWHYQVHGLYWPIILQVDLLAPNIITTPSVLFEAVDISIKLQSFENLSYLFSVGQLFSVKITEKKSYNLSLQLIYTIFFVIFTYHIEQTQIWLRSSLQQESVNRLCTCVC